MQRAIRNGKNEEANTEETDEAIEKKQSARELARWCHKTAQDQHSKASGSCSGFATQSFAGTARIAYPF
jgi:hypothetical protein